MERSTSILIVALTTTLSGAAVVAAAPNAPTPSRTASSISYDSVEQAPACKAAGGLTRLQGVSEASGIAASRRTPGTVWSHNDSGEPIIFAIAANGTVGRQVRLAGAQVVDWEDISVGPCGDGNCVYVADIGDNAASRSSVTIYRTPEPDARAGVTEKAAVLHAKYPDGSHDAEALLVMPKGEMFIVTKGETGPVALYRFPSAFQDGATVTLQRVAVLAGSDAKPEKNTKDDTKKKSEKGDKPEKGEKSEVKQGSGIAKADRITGADVSPDGQWIVLRTTDYIKFYLASGFTAGNAKEVLRYDVTGLGEPQGEGVAFSKEGDVVLVGEGGGKGQPGTIVRLTCTLR